MMKSLLCFLFLLVSQTQGRAVTQCDTTDRTTLKCFFPENINSTRKNFEVYFYPEKGDEVALVDCIWVVNELRCITQEGFECKKPVSEVAEISVPARFVNQSGTYRCIPDGYSTDSIQPCQFYQTENEKTKEMFPQTKDKEHSAFTDCEASIASEGSHVTLQCRFSLTIDSFTVHQHASVLANYTKSECRNSDRCEYMVEDPYEVFTVKLDMLEDPYGEYQCHPGHMPSLSFDVKTCIVTKQDESSSVPVIALALPIVVIIIVLMTIVLLVFLRQRRKYAKIRRKASEDFQRGRVSNDFVFLSV
ncbi:uncharacterized protein LOC112567920 [Pomacea canaliculata]|uniref:uncharacterized protein LOC112567920 n=1 Tax=Pomacea canaliculata TaxID=400727 RepID=UPI000D737210|nr:uncharacterized protein LOC112567920 [Pomacea canaliculata]